jgi:anti-sigma B factor antagonist
MQGITISVYNVGAKSDIPLMMVSGYVDTTTCQELAKEIQELIQEKKVQIIVDLGKVSYISSAGWGVFVGVIKAVREKGGDIKIVQMSSELFEVFEMLEFNRILNYYESIEEAIDEFDLIRGIDITKSSVEARQLSLNGGGEIQYIKPPVPISIQEKKFKTLMNEDDLPLKDFPLMEKIKRAVLEVPVSGIRDIQKKLNTEKYGYTRIGWFRLRSVLKTLSLETKEKRYRYYRSR